MSAPGQVLTTARSHPPVCCVCNNEMAPPPPIPAALSGQPVEPDNHTHLEHEGPVGALRCLPAVGGAAVGLAQRGQLGAVCRAGRRGKRRGAGRQVGDPERGCSQAGPRTCNLTGAPHTFAARGLCCMRAAQLPQPPASHPSLQRPACNPSLKTPACNPHPHRHPSSARPPTHPRGSSSLRSERRRWCGRRGSHPQGSTAST